MTYQPATVQVWRVNEIRTPFTCPLYCTFIVVCDIITEPVVHFSSRPSVISVRPWSHVVAHLGEPDETSEDSDASFGVSKVVRYRADVTYIGVMSVINVS